MLNGAWCSLSGVSLSSSYISCCCSMSSLWVKADSRVSARLSAKAAVFVVLAALIHSCSIDSIDAWSLAFCCLDMFV